MAGSVAPIGRTSNYVFMTVGILLLAAAASARWWSENKLAVRWEDLLLLVLPTLLWLLASGQLESLKIGSTGLQVKAAVQRAAQQKIEWQKSKINVEMPRMVNKKGGTAELQTIKKSYPQALGFPIQKTEWYDEYAVELYIRELAAQEGFKYFIFFANDKNKSLVGAIQASDLARHLSPKDGVAASKLLEEFVQILNGKAPPEGLQNFPGFIPTEGALKKTDDTKTALARMQERHVTWLPVVEGKSKFVGVVEQSRLAASLILEITKSLEEPRRGSQRA
jgi:hypothetical protein